MLGFSRKLWRYHGKALLPVRESRGKPKTRRKAAPQPTISRMDIDPTEGFEPGLLNLPDGRMRAYLIAYAITGNHGRARKAAKLAHPTPWQWQQQGDPRYLAALAECEHVIAGHLEDEARRRAVEGSRSYKFTKDGTPLRHPELCECSHSRSLHAMGTPATAGAEAPRVACTECSCRQFSPAYYFEHAYSDRLLELLLKAQVPEKYGDRLHLRGVLGSLDMGRLPDELVARIAAGDDPMEVLASASRETVRQLAATSSRGEIVVPGAQEAPPDAGEGPPASSEK